MTPATAQLRVAIVGAGFSGLSLANYVDRNFTSNNIEITIFETLEESADVQYLLGNICLPKAITIMKELGLEKEWQKEQQLNTDNNNDNNVMISRNKLKEYLKKNLSDKITLLYEQKVIEVKHVKANDGSGPQLELIVLDRVKNDICIKGPYDYVIAADGVMSVFRQCNFKNVALIGDARWVQDIFYDLGLIRINNGASIAMIDGIELGKILKMNNNNNNTNSNNNNLQLGKFSAIRKRYEIILRRLFLIFGIVLLISVSYYKVTFY